MPRNTIIAFIVIAGVAGLAFYILSQSHFFAIDNCLDDGGVWDESNEICECSYTAKGVYSDAPTQEHLHERQRCDQLTQTWIEERTACEQSSGVWSSKYKRCD